MLGNKKGFLSLTKDTGSSIEKLKKTILESDAILLGLGAGASTAGGFVYNGERFQKYFSDFASVYHFKDMYSGGFYPFKTPEEKWAFWSRHIYINRYMDAPRSFYRDLYRVVKDTDYFVLTTNVDHCLQKAGFDKRRMFYTQGDYGLWQCSVPCHEKTYDNEETVRAMVLSQGYEIADDGTLVIQGGEEPEMSVPSDLVPYCPVCGKPMAMNLRADDTFVQDEGWYAAQQRYEDFVLKHRNMRVLYLEIGVGFNTPVIIKYNFWRQVQENPKAVYACINDHEAYAPEEIAGRSIIVNGDAGEIIRKFENIDIA